MKHIGTKRRYSRMLGTSAAAAAGIAIVTIGGFYAFSGHHPQPYTTAKQKSQSFDFHAYLPFIPELPTYNVGYTLTSASIVRSMDNSHVNTAEYTAIYGPSAFVVLEAKPSQIHDAPEPWVPITMGNIHAQMYKHDKGESVKFIKGGVQYEVTSIDGGISYNDLLKVCKSISVPAKDAPTSNDLTVSGPVAVSQASKKFITPKQFVAPKGLALSEESFNAFQSTKPVKQKRETFNMSYKDGSILLSIEQSTDQSLEPVFDSSQYHTKTISGVLVHIRNANAPQSPQLPSAGFVNPTTEVKVVITSSLRQTAIERVVENLLHTSTTQANH